MRISDWSSDVCSSDLLRVWPQDLCRRRNCGACCGNTCNNRYLGKNAENLVSGCTRAYRSGDMKFDGINSRCAQRRAGCDDNEFPGFQIQIGAAVYIAEAPLNRIATKIKIGRASCRARVCQYVKISVVDGP